MKLMRMSLAAVLAFGVGATLPAFAQHDRDGDSRHERDKDDDHGKGRGRGHEDRGRHEGRERREEARDRHEERERREWREDRGHEQHEWREHEHERYAWYTSHHHRYIEEERFHARFGHEHPFVIVRPVIVAGRPRFQYGGYWFVIGRPLPPGWRYEDEVYVDFIDDGYYVCSPRHPGVHISVNIL
jgi:hypothetical protein